MSFRQEVQLFSYAACQQEPKRVFIFYKNKIAQGIIQLQTIFFYIQKENICCAHTEYPYMRDLGSKCTTLEKVE